MYRSFKSRKKKGNTNWKRDCKQRGNDGKRKHKIMVKMKPNTSVITHTHKILHT